MTDIPLDRQVAAYWDEHVHDLEIATHPVGTPEFFQELDDYRYDKLRYLPQLLNFASFKGKSLLEIGCGVGTDLVRFAEAGAVVTGIDISPVALELAGQNFQQHGLEAELINMDGASMDFPPDCFDTVYAHGVVQYAADPASMVQEIYRVLKPGGQAILMVYNKYSWLNLMSKITGVPLEHEDAPVYRKYSMLEFKRLLQPFHTYSIVPERFPVRTRLHEGWKARLFNEGFVGLFNLIPRRLTRPLGWHLIAFASRAP